MRGPAPWVALGAVAALLAAQGWVPGALGGIAVGFAVGAGYLWLLVRRAATLSGLPPQRALVAAQLGAVLRLAFVFAGFGLAARAWPEANLAWGAGAMLLPIGTSIALLARGG